MSRILMFICAYSVIVSANPCKSSFLVDINEAIHSNQEQIRSYQSKIFLYRNLSVVLEKITSDRSQPLTQKEIEVIIASLKDKRVCESVAEVLENNIPQSQNLFMALLLLLDRLELSPDSSFKPLQVKDAVARVIVKALDEPGLKDSSIFKLTSLLKYPSVRRKLNPEKIQELPVEGGAKTDFRTKSNDF